LPTGCPHFSTAAGGEQNKIAATTKREANVQDRLSGSGSCEQLSAPNMSESEIPEFDRKVLETLREPLEAGRITISRAAQQADFPAACQLVAAMNPCPCGWRGDPNGRCRCTPEIATRYLRKLSGPLLDRIDIQIELPALSPAELSARSATKGEASAAVARRVAIARERQIDRQGKTNRELDGREVDAVCRPDATGEALLREAGERFGWSARAYTGC
jgi:magnesium chelatase family protein